MLSTFMILQFSKYQGTGNDFVLIDGRQFPSLSTHQIQTLCTRKFGVGSDGLMILSPSDKADFRLDFYNPDGSESFCGNGSRCAVTFANDLNWVGKTGTFDGFDGLHEFSIETDGFVWIEMNVNAQAEKHAEGIYINTGAPHFVYPVAKVADTAVVETGSAIRYDNRFKPVGTNVNFVEKISDQEIRIRTYEKGVENETLSCGTGVTACALTIGKAPEVAVHSEGGDLKVRFTEENGVYANILLGGPAKKVFTGTLEL